MKKPFKVFGLTDCGLVRTHNEDHLLVDETAGVFAVCDGMGGHQAGEVASMMSGEILQTAFNHFKAQLHDDKNLSVGRTLPISGDVLIKAIRLANRAINNKADDNRSLQGMGTTIVAAALEGDMLSIAHVGDSRAYRIDDRSLTPLTVDHSWIAEIQQSQKLTEEEASSVVGKNIITRALGVRETVEVDYRLIKVKPEQKFLLCSDGLCGYADDEDIFQAINKVRDDAQKMAANLIQLANDRGGADNVTVVVLEIGDVKAANLPEVPVFTLNAETKEQLETENIWLEKINQYFTERDSQANITANKQPKKSLLFLIFAIFIVFAFLIIYFTTGR